MPVLLKEDTRVPGGAGNVATNLAALGAKPVIFAVVELMKVPNFSPSLKTWSVYRRNHSGQNSSDHPEDSCVARNWQLVRIDRENGVSFRRAECHPRHLKDRLKL